MKNWNELDLNMRTYWYEAGVFDEEEYLEWIELGIKSPAVVLCWKELGALVAPTVQILMIFGIRTPAELRDRFISKWRSGIPYSIQELINDFFFDNL